jgi:hypothetical protein
MYGITNSFVHKEGYVWMGNRVATSSICLFMDGKVHSRNISTLKTDNICFRSWKEVIIDVWDDLYKIRELKKQLWDDMKAAMLQCQDMLLSSQSEFIL